LNFAYSELNCLLTPSNNNTNLISAKKSKKSKKSKTDKPKRKLSAFMNFSKQNRSRIASENPDMGFAELGAEMGRLWKAMSESEKAAYKLEDEDEAAAEEREEEEEEEEEEEGEEEE
jgi:hypothetical protein